MCILLTPILVPTFAVVNPNDVAVDAMLRPNLVYLSHLDVIATTKSTMGVLQ